MALTGRRGAAVGAVLASALIGTAAAGPPVPTVVKAEPAPEWDAKFAGDKGWIGGDGAFSIRLGPKRVLWLFGDTLLGTVKDGGRPGAAMVNNTLAVQTGLTKDATLRFVAGKSADGKPAAFFTPADRTTWYWPQAGVRQGDRLYVFLAHLRRKGDGGAFGFRQVGEWLAVVENPDDEPEKWRVKQHRVPHAEYTPKRERSWGSAVLVEGGQVYVYGFDEERGKGLGKRRLTVARVPSGKLGDFAAWRFLTSDGWSKRAADAAPLAGGMATELSVGRLPTGKGYVAVYTQNGLGDRILGRFASAPDGPWSAPVLLYRCPEMARDKGVFCYGAKAHAWAAAGNDLIVSYCVNTWKFERLFRDEKVYRPRFVRVRLRAAK
jgi:hypothetical protein